jgi:hypothetical protein
VFLGTFGQIAATCGRPAGCSSAMVSNALRWMPQDGFTEHSRKTRARVNVFLVIFRLRARPPLLLTLMR